MTMETFETSWLSPQRVALGLLTIMLLALALAPMLLLNTPERTGREGLAFYRGVLVGEITVTEQLEAQLRAGFQEQIRADGATVLGSPDPSGACWQLVLGDGGVPVGPSPAPPEACVG
jgi:hypothetical protein